MYIPVHFQAWELVPIDIYELMGDQSFILLSTQLLITIDQIRNFFNSRMTINDYKNGGDHHFRGFRHALCLIGGKESQHRFGNAADGIIEGVPADKARKAIIANAEDFPYLTRMEEGVPWLHIDCKSMDEPGIHLFKA